MTAVIDAEHKTIGCPHCQGKINVEVERKPATVTVFEDRIAAIEKKVEKPEPVAPREPTKQEKVLPSFVPGYVCKDCGEVHKNKGYKRKAKFKCDTPDCGQFSGSDNANCPWCGKRDWVELDDDTKEMLPDPNAKDDHEHDD